MDALVSSCVLFLISIWYSERVAIGALVTAPLKEYFCEGTRYFSDDEPTPWITAHHYCSKMSAKLARPHKVKAISRCLHTTPIPFLSPGYWVGGQISSITINTTSCMMCLVRTGVLYDQDSCSITFPALCEGPISISTDRQGHTTSGLQTPGFVFVDQSETSTVPTMPVAPPHVSALPELNGPTSRTLDIHAVKFERRHNVCWTMLEVKSSQNVLHCARYCSRHQHVCSGFLQDSTSKLCFLYTQPEVLPCPPISANEALYELC